MPSENPTTTPHGEPFLTLEDASIRAGSGVVFDHTNWTICTDQHWAIVGPNGSGKSLLARALWHSAPLAGGRITYHFDDGRPYESRPWYDRRAEASIQHVSFEDQAQALGAFRSYFQERWFSQAAENAMTVDEFLSRESIYRINPYQILEERDYPPEFDQHRSRALDLLNIRSLLDCKMLHLSNGETRKVLLARALAQAPKLLILDDPFAGLDPASRDVFAQTLDNLLDGSMRIVLATPRLDEVPQRVTHVLQVSDRKVIAMGPRPASVESTPHRRKTHTFNLPPRGRAAQPSPGPTVVMENVCVRYGDRVILDRITWTVGTGEYWAVVGPNGCGKTTLLGLIMGDNPQAYANTIRVLGHPPGSGIWKLRERIGWLSPDLQIHYPSSYTCRQVVCSGFHESLGLFRAVAPDQKAAADVWITALGCAEWADSPFAELSTGQQRMMLLARAMVKEPDLLLLDEPCQGLDHESQDLLLDAIEAAAAASIAVIHVTHHAEDLPERVSHILQLHQGRAVRMSPWVVG